MSHLFAKKSSHQKYKDAMDTSTSDDVLVFYDAGVGDDIVTDNGQIGSADGCEGYTNIPSHDNNHFKSMKWNLPPPDSSNPLALHI